MIEFLMLTVQIMLFFGACVGLAILFGFAGFLVARLTFTLLLGYSDSESAVGVFWVALLAAIAMGIAAAMIGSDAP